MTPDMTKLHKVLEHIRSLPDCGGLGGRLAAEQDGWRQDDWLITDGDRITDQGVTRDGKPCGTAACFAGWTAIMFAPSGTKVRGACLTLPDGTQQPVREYAKRELGLDEPAAISLFACHNRLDGLERIIDKIGEGACNG
jgi:hypothetical protein